MTVEYRKNWKGKEKMTDKPLIWPEEVCKMFSEKNRNKSRQGKNNINNSKRDVDRRSCETCKKKGFKKEIVDQINHVRLHKKVFSSRTNRIERKI